MDCTDVVDVRHLAKTYGGVTAVRDVTLRVGAGEIFGFLGPNGAGKTTCVKMLVGLVRPTAGRGTVLQAPLGDRLARKKLGYLPELFRFQEWLSAREVLALHCRLAQVRPSEREIARALEMVGLGARTRDRVGTYSKGMQQRLGIAAALIGEPDLIVLDEPTSALDPVGRHDVRRLLRELKAKGTAVFLNSHLLGEVEQVCDRVAIVSAGSVVAQGTIPEIVGLQKAVRVRAVSNGTPLEPLLEAFGTVQRQADGFVVSGIERERIPLLVRTLAQADARVYAVEPLGTSLEERFLEIAQEPHS